jgi:phospholipid/cholesterol/gamma-HCH transport system substrate-binding protein/paraquat-inducible protein B
MIEANRYKLGVFIAVALTLIVASFFLVGLSKIFEPRLELLTVFRDSVEGLKIGSPVKYKGVPLGNVTRIAMRDSDEYIDVYMVIYSSSMDSICRESENQIVQCNLNSLHDYFLRLKKKGITCSLQSAGLTGGAFIDLDKSPNGTHLFKTSVKPPYDVLYIPSRPSHVTAVIENLSKVAEELAQINFIKLSGQLKRTFDSIDAKLNDPKIEEIISKASDLSAKLDRLISNVDKDSLKKLYDDLVKMLASIDELAGKTNETRANMVVEFGGLKSRIISSLDRLDETMSAVSELANELDENPTALIRGKAKPEIIKPE